MNFSFLSRLALPLALLFGGGLRAQNSPILEAYIQQGLQANLAVQQQSLEVRKAEEAMRQSKGLSLPKLGFEANYTVAGGGRRIDFPIGDLLNPLYTALGSPVRLENQEILFLPNNFHETKVNFAYPVFNTDLKYNRQIQQHLHAGKVAQQQLLTHNLRYDITAAYLRLLQTYEAEKIWQNAKTVLLELRRFNESLVRNNVATKDIVSTADYEISKAEHEIFSLQSARKTAAAYFNLLINKDLQSEVLVDSTLLRGTTGQYQREALVQQALERRQEFAALRAGQAAAEGDVARNAANLRLPDVYLGGSLGFQGFGYTFDQEQAYVLAQVGLTYDLFDGGQRRSKTQEARLQAEKVRLQTNEAQRQVAMQVTAAWNDFEVAQNALQTAQSGLSAAEASFRIVSNKYRANQALLLEFLDAQNRVTTAQLQRVLAWSDVLLKEAALKQAAGI
jgi:outer membrane protein TolC